MKQTKHLTSILDSLAECGVNLTQLSTEIGLCQSTLRTAKSLGHSIQRIDDLARLLKLKAKVLALYDPNKHSLSYVCQEAAVKQAHLAKKIGISKQGLHKLQYHLSDSRKQQLRKEIQSIADHYGHAARMLDALD